MSDLTADGIRERMARIRTRARGKADQLGAETRQFLDWKHYVRLYPWATVAAAAAVGYFVVPRRPTQSATQLDTADLARLARDHRIVVAPPETAKKPGLLDSAFSLLSNSLLRAGIAFAGQQVGRLLTPRPSEPDREGRHDFVESLS